MSRKKEKTKENIEKWTAREKLNSDDSDLDESDEVIKPPPKKDSPLGLTLDSDEEWELSRKFLDENFVPDSQTIPENIKPQDPNQTGANINSNPQNEENLTSFNSSQSTNQKKTETMTTITDILKDIEKFSVTITDVNKFISSVRNGDQFIDATKEQDVLRYLNGAKKQIRLNLT